MTTIPSTSTLFHKYTLGSSSIHDETGGSARVIFRHIDPKKMEPEFEIYIQNKKMILPAMSKSDRLLFWGRHVFSLVPAGDDFLKISIQKNEQQTTYYVNKKKLGKDFCVALKCIPKSISLEEAKIKVCKITQFPDFKSEIALFNSHGIVILGHEKGQEALYWAKPDQEEFSKVEIKPVKDHFLISLDGCLVLESSLKEASLFINGDYAERLPLNHRFSHKDDNG